MLPSVTTNTNRAGWWIEQEGRRDPFRVSQAEKMQTDPCDSCHQVRDEIGSSDAAAPCTIAFERGPLDRRLCIGLHPEVRFVGQQRETQQELGIASLSVTERIVLHGSEALEYGTDGDPSLGQ